MTVSRTATGSARLEIDDRACVLSGVCASLAPDRFDLGEHRTEVLDPAFDPDATGPDADAVHDAIACCPAAAITLTEPE